MDYSNSCLMLSMSLFTGIDLSAVFKEEDLIGTGIERDSHITVFFSPDKVISKIGMLDKINTLLGEDSDFIGKFKLQERYKVLDYFEVGKFENESDYLVLKLQKDNELYDTLGILNTGLVSAYDIKSTFKDYTPHMTLAELQPGTAKNYMFSPILGLILESAEFSIDDFVLSYGTEESEYKQFNITSENAVNRYFRQKELFKDKEYFDAL